MKKGTSPKKGLVKAKPSKAKKSQKKKLTLQGQPKHRDLPRGVNHRINASFGAQVYSIKNQDITTNQINAFKRQLTSKTMRKRLLIRTNPYLILTKKPSEVRMGGGRGVKINRIVNPLVPGSKVCEIPVDDRIRNPDETGKSVARLFSNALKKLPITYRVYRMDL